MLSSRSLQFAVLISLLVLAGTTPASQWPTDATDHVSVSSAFDRQLNQASVADGQGGVIVVWEDLRDQFSWNLFAQRISADGVPLWTTDGVVVNDEPTNQTQPQVVTDGQGGAIVVWQDDRNFNADIYAQRIGPDGALLWAAAGVPVTTFPDNQYDFEAAADGLGGVVVAWSDLRTGDIDIYAQRLDAAGTAQWTADGQVVCSVLGSQQNPAACGDGAGGIVVAWEDWRGVDRDIYAQRLDDGGAAQWTVNGVVCTTTAGDQSLPDVAPAFDGGAFVVWEGVGWDGYAGIYGRRLSAFDGSDQWGAPPNSGQALRTDEDVLLSVFHEPRIVPDGEDGALVAFWQMNFGSTDEDVHLMRVGPYSWDLERWETPVVDTPGHHTDHQLVADGAGGAVLTWIDTRNGNGNDDIYAQRIDGNGNDDWPEDGIPVALATGDQLRPQVVADGRGGGIFVWQDDSAGPIDLNVMAQRIEGWGFYGYPSPAITSIEDLPLDQGNQVVLSWTASYLDNYPDGVVNGYSIWRMWLGGGAKAAGAASLGSGASPGLPAEANASLAQGGWNYVATQDAQWQSEYSFVAPTFADSSGAGFDQTAFMVIAETNNVYRFWESLPDTGYSVDNLTPSAPLALMGALEGPDARLDWQLPGENNDDIVAYRLYGDAAPGVVPGPAFLVAETPDLTYLDTTIGGDTRYYVVTAVDDVAHEGPASNEVVVSGVSGVGDLPATVTTLTLRGTFPNPFNPATEIRFALPPDGGFTRIDIHDVDGRRVRHLLAATLPGGPHATSWDGRDDAGRGLASGVYLATVSQGGETRTARMMLVK